MKQAAITILVLLFFASCTKDDPEIDQDNLLLGTWNYTGQSISYFRAESFIDNRGYQFNADGTLLERNIAGFCATPPVSYSDYHGTWTMVNDTLIRVDVEYWGGNRTYILDVESVDERVLQLSIVPNN